MNDDERGELVTAMQQLAAMVDGLLDLPERLAESLKSGERPSPQQIDELRIGHYSGGSSSIACGNGWRV